MESRLFVIPDFVTTVKDYLFRRNFDFLLILHAFLILAISPAAGCADETLIVQIDVNHVTKGEYFVTRDNDGFFSLNRNDLAALGLAVTSWPEDLKFIPLSMIKEAEWSFNEASLTLSLHLPTGMLPRSHLDLSPPRQHEVLYPNDNSAFLNYRLNFNQHNRSESAFGAFELGVRRGNLLFLSNHQTNTSSSGSENVRLMTSLTYDRRQELQRTVFGDYLTPQNVLGGGLRLAGVSFAKRYDMNPYLVRYPLVKLQGSVETPAEVDIYQNGLLLKTEKIAPGDFSIENLGGLPGFGEVDLIIRDIYGRETRIARPYYLSDQLLDQGRHEYSYSIGALRHDFGTEGDRYHSLAVSAQHRYGFSSTLSMGTLLEYGEETGVLSPQFLAIAGTRGLVTGTAAISHSNGKSGQAAAWQYFYNHYPFNARIGIKRFSQKFCTVSTPFQGEVRSGEYAAGLGWSHVRFGSINFDLTRTELYEGGERGRAALGLNRRVGGNLYLNLNLARSLDSTAAWSVYATLQFTPKDDLQTALRTEIDSGFNNSSLQVQKSQPFGEGTSYHVLTGATDTHQGGTQYANGMIQQNAPFGIYRGEWQLTGDARGSDYDLTASTAGSLIVVGREIRAARPVEDSFALIQVGHLANVTVTQNGQEVGRTGQDGKLVLPSLTAFYENQIGIDDQAIPLNYGISELSRYISPPWRSGSCVYFDVRRSQPLTGRLKMRQGDKLIPVEYRELSLSSGLTEYRLPTGRDGEFYFDPKSEHDRKRSRMSAIRVGCNDQKNVAATDGITSDSYHGRVIIGDKVYTFEVFPPQSEELFIDLGDIVIEETGGSSALSGGDQP